MDRGAGRQGGWRTEGQPERGPIGQRNTCTAGQLDIRTVRQWDSRTEGQADRGQLDRGTGGQRDRGTGLENKETHLIIVDTAVSMAAHLVATQRSPE